MHSATGSEHARQADPASSESSTQLYGSAVSSQRAAASAPTQSHTSGSGAESQQNVAGGTAVRARKGEPRAMSDAPPIHPLAGRPPPVEPVVGPTTYSSPAVEPASDPLGEKQLPGERSLALRPNPMLSAGTSMAQADSVRRWHQQQQIQQVQQQQVQQQQVQQQQVQQQHAAGQALPAQMGWTSSTPKASAEMGPPKRSPVFQRLASPAAAAPMGGAAAAARHFGSSRPGHQRRQQGAGGAGGGGGGRGGGAAVAAPIRQQGGMNAAKTMKFRRSSPERGLLL